MQIRRITDKYNKIEPIKALYERSFPENERRAFADLVDEDSEGMEFYAFYEEDELIGMLSLLSYKDITHIMYLAVDEKYQSHGYGSFILSTLRNLKSGQRIIADLERITDHSPNNEQRERRNAFYIRNGYSPSGVKYSWRNEDYELYVNGGEFYDHEYRAFWQHFSKNSLKKKIKSEITSKNCFTNIIGGGILAFGLYNIHSISSITEGGIPGLTMLLLHHFSISPALSGFVMNFICYALGLKVLGFTFIIYSAVAGGSFSLFYALFELFPPIIPSIANYPFIAATVGALFVGVGIGLCVRTGGAPGGDDALAISASHLIKINIRWAYLFSDLSVLLLSLTYIPMSKLIYSFYTVILSGQIIGIFQKK